MSTGRSIFRVLAPFAVLALGVVAMVALIQTRPQAIKVAPQRVIPVVEVVSAKVVDGEHVSVHGMGTVRPARLLTLQAEVTGRVVAHHGQLVSGGRVREGEELLRIDDRDYVLIAEQQRAQVARAKLDLQMELGRKAIAEQEWGALGSSLTPSGDAGRSLALREPHLKAARSAVHAARSALERALLQVERTVITAPFNAYVREESIEVGQYVGPQTPLATLVGTDAVWVEASLPVDKLSWIHLPLPGDGGDPGSVAWVHQDVGRERPLRWKGRVLRLLGELDPQGRMARVLIEVQRPFGAVDGSGVPLLVGAYVGVAIEGRAISGVIEIPRLALREADHVWIVDGDGLLARRTVTIAWRDKERLLVSSGLSPGDRVVCSPLMSPMVGSVVRVMSVDSVAAEAP